MPALGNVLARRYRLDAAHGGSPGCFQATDLTTGARVLVRAAGAGGRIEREAELLARLDHPGIVRFEELGSAAGRPFLVLEWIEGGDLGTWLRQPPEPLTDARLIRLLERLSAAVAAIHAGGWLHRDLEPANVMVRADGAPVIVDFGAASPFGQRVEPAPHSDLTEGYAAPEQYLTDRPEGPWTDVYGLGAIAYRALFGEPPLPAPERLRGEAMALAMDRAGRHAEALCRAVDWALALEVAARPQSVADWSAALSLAASDVAAAPTNAPVSRPAVQAPREDCPPTVRVRRVPHVRATAAPPPSVPSPAAPPARRRAALLVATLLALLAAGLAGALWYGRPLYERHLKTDWVVDPSGDGDALTIADAIARAGDGATIAIRPGIYDESLTIARPLHLVPAVPEAPPLIAPSAGPCLTATGAGGSISGLRFAAAPAAVPEAKPAPCLALSHGGFSVEDNQIQGGAGAAILIGDGGTSAIVANVIEGGRAGIVVIEGAAPEITGNHLRGVEGPALVVRGGAAPSVVDNIIEDSGAVVITEGAGGRLEGNRISASTSSGIEVTTGADPQVVVNTIERAAGAGLFVYGHGRGRFERNIITGNALSGVVVSAGASARLAGNTVGENTEHGILIVEGGRAVLEGNTVARNQRNGIVIEHDSEAELTDNELSGNAEPQLLDARPMKPAAEPGR
jgi:parallel beta-helix repeat protein